jgi:2-dehydro-3-deoxyphosphooctonate aldolase (KDO 8-P synthase)
MNFPHSRNTNSGNFFLLAGPCVVESEELVMEVAEKVFEMTNKLKIPFVFKSSYRKANRSRSDSFTGIGDENALEILARVKARFDVPVVTDIHTAEEAAIGSKIC